MKYNNFKPELALNSSNIHIMLTTLQNAAFQWQCGLSNLSALAKMLPSKAANARLGLLPSAVAQCFYSYALFLAQVNANRPRFIKRERLEPSLELTRTLDLPKLKP